MKREKQKFYGVLTDKELYIIEDGLVALSSQGKDTSRLIEKLYNSFAELPKGLKLVTAKE